MPVLVASHANDGVKQAMDRQLSRCDRVGDGIDQERHVVVDDPDAHAAVPGLTPGRFNCQGEFVLLPRCSNVREELSRLTLIFAPETLRFAGKRIPGQRLANGFNQRLRQARLDRHEKSVLHELRMRAAYRPALARGTTPWTAKVLLSGFADGALDQRFVVEDSDCLMRAVRGAARDHDRELDVRRHFGQRHGRS